MAEISRPWQTTAPGDAGPYSSNQWATTWRHLIGFGAEAADRGPIRGVLNELQVSANSPADNTVILATGAAVVQGKWYMNSAPLSFTIADNGTVNNRIDTLVLEALYVGTQTVRARVVQGPLGGPVRPTLTQNTEVQWQIPIADITVAPGSPPTIAATDISQRQCWANIPDRIEREAYNNSGAILVDGDLVIWDSTANSGVNLNNTIGAGSTGHVAGVIESYIPIAGTGRVVTHGICYVNYTGAVARGDYLVPSDTFRLCQADNGSRWGVFGRALEAGANGRVLAFIDVEYPTVFSRQSDNVLTDQTTTSAVYVDIPGCDLTINKLSDWSDLYAECDVVLGQAIVFSGYARIYDKTAGVQYGIDIIAQGSGGGTRKAAGHAHMRNTTLGAGLAAGNHNFVVQFHADGVNTLTCHKVWLTVIEEFR